MAAYMSATGDPIATLPDPSAEGYQPASANLGRNTTETVGPPCSNIYCTISKPCSALCTYTCNGIG